MVKGYCRHEKCAYTGSFNFTKAAEEKNAENLLVIKGNKPLLDITSRTLKRIKDTLRSILGSDLGSETAHWVCRGDDTKGDVW
jgi:phosphatidylserine/phosphatidylglycerophosphate/cardiolipin synthase-like enzyme